MIRLFIILFLLSPLAHASRLLRCHTLESTDFPDAYALGIGRVRMTANCHDRNENHFDVSFYGRVIGVGASLSGEILMTENTILDATRYFLMACPITKLDQPRSFSFALVETGIFFGAIAGLGINKGGGVCAIAGGGSFIMGALAEFSKVIIAPTQNM